jgi:hypothetical protein
MQSRISGGREGFFDIVVWVKVRALWCRARPVHQNVASATPDVAHEVVRRPGLMISSSQPSPSAGTWTARAVPYLLPVDGLGGDYHKRNVRSGHPGNFNSIYSGLSYSICICQGSLSLQPIPVQPPRRLFLPLHVSRRASQLLAFSPSPPPEFTTGDPVRPSQLSLSSLSPVTKPPRESSLSVGVCYTGPSGGSSVTPRVG